jgi:hypothetical protein
MGVPVPPGANVLIVKGAYPNSESVWLHDAEVLDLVEREGWYERPPPPDAKSGFWDGKGEWSEDPEEGLYDLPPEIDMPPAIPEGRRMKVTRRQLRRIIREAIDPREMEEPLGGWVGDRLTNDPDYGSDEFVGGYDRPVDWKVGDLVRKVDYYGTGYGEDYKKSVGKQIGTVIEIDEDIDGTQYTVIFPDGSTVMDTGDSFEAPK